MSWTEHAACADRKDIDFFPVYEGAITKAWRENTAAAKAVCSTCPVKDDCLADALTHWGTAGIWGGTTEIEREKMPRPRQRVSVAACGTDAGYYRHLRYTFTPACDACREAHATYQRVNRPSRPARARRKAEAAA